MTQSMQVVREASAREREDYTQCRPLSNSCYTTTITTTSPMASGSKHYVVGDGYLIMVL